MILIVLWHGHLAVEQASCLFYSSGIWLWNRHLACFIPRESGCRTGILPVSFPNRHLTCFIPRQAGCPPHSYSSEDSAMLTKLKLCIIH
ncbi:hypothetical protein [Moorena sp. SIOASIH]|uniref:hypothetical protein n=1 Tax=Moorena sp. SIOASIH TaxID=2607817 RepID=UPI0025CF506B|nr:hypothetical protein [Moorena sp. SIOASIH]